MLQKRSHRKPDTWQQNELCVDISKANAGLGRFIYCHSRDDICTTEISTQATENLLHFIYCACQGFQSSTLFMLSFYVS